MARVKVFVTADPHFGHQGVCEFLRKDGTKLRPWDNYADMDAALVENWNSVVGEKDKVYVLGDVCFRPRHLETIGKCNGDKVLIKGNHDVLKISQYLKYFRDIRACQIYNKMLLTHIPIHESQFHRWTHNIHGHLHANKIDDPRYICVSVEHTNFRPVEIDSLV